MAFKHLKDCDSSDMGLWANSPMCENLISEIKQDRDKALRELIKKPTEESAATVRAFDKMFALIEECKKMR